MRALILLAVLGTPAAVSAQASGVLPGQWDIAVTTDSVTMTGMPPEVAKSMTGRTVHIKHCITPAEAATGPQAILRGDKSCTFTKYQMLGGRLHAEMLCRPPGGGTMTSVSDGSVTPTGFRATGRTVMTGAAAMTMTATTVGTRLGACAK